MSDIETPPGGEAAAAGTIERPDYIPEKFWDGEGGKPRVDELAKSYVALESAMGRRIQEVSADTRRIIAQALPDEVRGAWADELKGQLVADPEFLTPLEEAWRAKHLPKAPEAYEVPAREDGTTYDPEHPLYTAAVNAAKKYGLPQEALAEIMDLTYQARAEYEIPPDVSEWKLAIPDIDSRAKAVYNKLLGASPDHADALINQVRDPNAFLALEAIVKAGTPKSLALEPAAHEPEVTQEKLDEMMRDPKYWRERDPAFINRVSAGFNRLYGDTL